MVSSVSKFEVVKFDGTGNFGLWQQRVKDLLVQQGLVKALKKKPEAMSDDTWEELQMKAVSTIRLCLADEVMYHVIGDESPAGVWAKLESRYMSKSLTNKLFLKQKLFGLKMAEGSDLIAHINTFNQIVSDLLRIEVVFDEENQAQMLLSSLPESMENLVTTLLWGKETLELEEVTAALLAYNQRRQQTEGVSGQGLVVKGKNRGRGTERGKSVEPGKSRVTGKSAEQEGLRCFTCHETGHFKRDCPWRRKNGGKGIGKAGPSNSASVVENSADESDDGDMLLTVSENVEHREDSWVLDSACSFHMSPNRELFDTYRGVNCGSVSMGNGAVCKVIGIGTVRLRMADGVVRTLGGVRHVPGLSRNVISLGALDSKGCGYKAAGGVMRVTRGARVVMKASRDGGKIYRLDGTTVVGGAVATTAVETGETLLRHMEARHVEEQGNQERLETCGAGILEAAGQVDQWRQQTAELETCGTGSAKPVGQVEQRERSLGTCGTGSLRPVGQVVEQQRGMETCGTGRPRPVGQVDHGKKGIATGRPRLAEGSSGKKPVGRKWVHRRKAVGRG